MKDPDDETFQDRLVWALNHQLQEIRLQACRALEALGPAAVDKLDDMTRVWGKSADPYTRAALVRSIAALQTVPAMRTVLRTLSDPSVVVRREGLDAIVRNIDAYRHELSSATIEALRRTTEHDSSDTARQLAMEAISRLQR